MDRPTTRTEADARSSRLDPNEALVLPSRRPALDLCRSAAGHGGGVGVASAGPVLVTGDAGVGKTWLWRRLVAESPAGRRWIAVDLTPSDDPVDFYRLIGHELGLIDPSSRAPDLSRVDLVDFLAARLADAERINLVVEEAHNLTSDLWEEVRVLANRLGRPGGFASMILVGQTALAVRFSTRPFRAIEARLESKVHLGPIGVDEAKEYLSRLQPGREWPEDELELLHRDAGGNPRRLLRLVGPRAILADDNPTLSPIDNRKPADRSIPAIGHREDIPKADDPPTVPLQPGAQARIVPPTLSPMPLTGPSRPPIRVEENMIEVGWSAEEAPSSEGGVEGSGHRPGVAGASEGGEEAVRDHYAALQAWREWSENQARRSPGPIESVEDEPDFDEELEESEPEFVPPPRSDRPTVRAEGEQKFAPFGQLFSKMAQALEPE